MKPLSNLHVLITRPPEQGQELANAISGAGGVPILFPSIVIQDIENKFLSENIKKNLAWADKIIFLSAHAARKVIALQKSFPKQVSVLAIGSATAEILIENDIKVDFFPVKESNSESLLQSAPLLLVKNSKIVIFSGEGGRNLLYNELTKRGAQVIKIPVYRRVCPNSTSPLFLYSTIPDGPFIITCTSTETLKNLYFILKNADQTAWLKNQLLLVVSQRIARYASVFGFNEEHILFAKNASTQAIIETLISWYAKFNTPRKLPQGND